MKLLRIDSSTRLNSVTRQLTGRFAEAWQHEHPEGTVIERDLATTTLPQVYRRVGACRAHPIPQP